MQSVSKVSWHFHIKPFLLNMRGINNNITIGMLYSHTVFAVIMISLLSTLFKKCLQQKKELLLYLPVYIYLEMLRNILQPQLETDGGKKNNYFPKRRCTSTFHTNCSRLPQWTILWQVDSSRFTQIVEAALFWLKTFRHFCVWVHDFEGVRSEDEQNLTSKATNNWFSSPNNDLYSCTCL